MKFETVAKSFTLKNLPESEIELTGEVPFDVVAPYREQALQHIAEHLEMPGFRPGKVPAAMALQKVGEVSVLEEATELFVKDFYPELVETLKVDVVGRPDIRVTKLAPNNPVGLVIHTSVYPVFEVESSWKSLKDLPLEPYTGELPKTEVPASAEEEQKARDYLARDKRRTKIVEKLLDDTPLAVPKLFIESELEKMMAQMREDVQKFGMSWEDYLKRVSKTEDGVRDEFRAQATKRAKLQLILNKLAADEKVEIDQTEVEKEMKHALEHFPQAKPGLVRIHIETVLRNEKVLGLLEGETEKAEK